jgi:cytochrome c biogenesis protein
MRKIIFKTLADLRFAITILLIIAISSIIGTIIEQDQSIEIYKLNYPLTNRLFGFLSWDIILKFGFDHVYTTWWFICFILLFGTSLLVCTFIQQIPALKIARRCQFLRTYKQFYQLKIVKNLQVISLSKLFYQIQKNQYSIFQQRNIFYCYKGLIGKIAPITVHLSMILILLGSIISALWGFKAQEIVAKTETVHIQNVLFNGPFVKIPNISTRVNDFWITYTTKNTINQYYSDISILNNLGNELQQHTIFVNQPAKFNGIDYYQTDWNLLGVRVKLDNLNVLQYPLISVLNQRNKLWISWISTTKTLKDGFVILMHDLQGYCSIYDKLGLFLGNLELNETFNINYPLILIDILSSSGLQIKVDPGIPFIYTGFGFLMISTLLSYITYSQIWILQESEKIFVGGNTTRAQFDFELEFLKLIKLN